MTDSPTDGAAPLHPEGTWYCEQHKMWHGKCHRKGGGRCHRPHTLGLPVCSMHGGRGNGQEARHLLAIEQNANPIAGEPMQIGAVDALLWRIGVLAGEVARLDVVVANLSAQQMVWGRTAYSDSVETLTVEAADGDGQRAARRTQAARRSEERAGLHMWQVLRAQRERELRQLCVETLHAGVEERRVEIAKQQAAVVYRVVLAILGDFGIGADDERIPVIVPARFRELTPA